MDEVQMGHHGGPWMKSQHLAKADKVSFASQPAACQLPYCTAVLLTAWRTMDMMVVFLLSNECIFKTFFLPCHPPSDRPPSCRQPGKNNQRFNVLMYCVLSGRCAVSSSFCSLVDNNLSLILSQQTSVDYILSNCWLVHAFRFGIAVFVIKLCYWQFNGNVMVVPGCVRLKVQSTLDCTSVQSLTHTFN